MTVVNLDKIGLDVSHRQKAVMWLYDNYGPCGDIWKISQLSYVEFKHDKHATFFCLKWS